MSDGKENDVCPSGLLWAQVPLTLNFGRITTFSTDSAKAQAQLTSLPAAQQ